jgi:hypothetical protein
MRMHIDNSATAAVKNIAFILVGNAGSFKSFGLTPVPLHGLFC